MTRRDFFQTTIAGTAALAAYADPAPPWYRRALRWGQTNITERDPTRYDIAWWRQYWKRTQVQGVIINAGGIVAYYPSRFPLHRRAGRICGRGFFRGLGEVGEEAGRARRGRRD